MSKFDKYFDDFSPKEGESAEKGAGITVNDLQAVESRINHYIDESIKRLDTKLDAVTNKENNTTTTTETVEQNESEVNENV